MTTDITSQVKYIGADDVDLKLFEGQYAVPQGISYNSYVIFDEKIAVMDTIDSRKEDEWFKNLETALNGRQPDYLIVQHMEPDHSSAIDAFAKRYPQATIVATAKAIQMLSQFFEDKEVFEGRTKSVKEGETLSLGSHTLKFFMAPMVHWPEVMVTYEESEKILFSADAFGKFGAISKGGEWKDEARRYYINICGKYGMQVQNLLKKAATLDIHIICPLHGPVLTENIGEAVSLYDTWSKYEPEENGVLVAYASIHEHTAKAARKMAEILRQKGAKVVVMDLSRDDQSEAVANAFRFSTLVVAAASYDAGVFPPMHDFLYHLQIKGYQKRRVAIIENGSWAPTAGRVMACMISDMKNIDLMEKVITIKSSMKAENISDMEELANSLLA